MELISQKETRDGPRWGEPFAGPRWRPARLCSAATHGADGNRTRRRRVGPRAEVGRLPDARPLLRMSAVAHIETSRTHPRCPRRKLKFRFRPRSLIPLRAHPGRKSLASRLPRSGHCRSRSIGTPRGKVGRAYSGAKAVPDAIGPKLRNSFGRQAWSDPLQPAACHAIPASYTKVRLLRNQSGLCDLVRCRTRKRSIPILDVSRHLEAREFFAAMRDDGLRA